VEISWRGPFQIQTYLDNAISRDPLWQDRWPRERDAVYVVSEREWNGQPDETAHILYVGGNTGDSARFATRIGDLIADIFGFYGQETGHHCGGRTLWQWCDHRQFPPARLWLGWGTSRCSRCAEKYLYDKFPKATKNVFDENGLRNKISPPACSRH
jgi:hypothetical protein